jgi:hypothetical protein
VGPSRGELNSQTLAALGAAGVDHSATATGFHADQKAVSAGATNFGRLVCAFHFGNPKRLKRLIASQGGACTKSTDVRFSPENFREPQIIANFCDQRIFAAFRWCRNLLKP